jgi:hypothetical protein
LLHGFGVQHLAVHQLLQATKLHALSIEGSLYCAPRTLA